MKQGTVRKPKDGLLGTCLISFVQNGQVCREMVAATVSPMRKAALSIERNIPDASRSYHTFVLTNGNCKVKRNDVFMSGNPGWNKHKKPFRKIQLNDLMTPLEDIANAIEKSFVGSERKLLGIKITIGNRRECWANKVFRKKLMDMEALQILGLSLDRAVQETCHAVKKEFLNFA